MAREKKREGGVMRGGGWPPPLPPGSATGIPLCDSVIPCDKVWVFNNTTCLCPSPSVPNLFLNEDEWTIRVYPGCHSRSFQSIPIHSNCVLLIRVGLAGEYESFEHVQKLRVASTNKFHSCLTHWQLVAIVFVAQLTYCILVIHTIFLLYSGCSYCILGHSYM